MDEEILVVPRRRVDALGLLGEGITPGAADVVASLEREAQWMPRTLAETDPAYKQLIPYAVAVRGGDVFVMERLRGGAEARLHGRLSIGIGGHVDRVGEGETRGAVALARDREWDEEVEGSNPPRWTFVGTLNVDADEVGRVHLGVVYRATLPDGATLQVRETHKLEGAFRSPAWCRDRRERLETWSRYALEACAARPAG